MCCCKRRKPADAPSGKGKGGDPALDRIQAKFQAAFDQTFTVEDSIRTFLQTDIFTAYEPVFVASAIAERAASAKGKGKGKGKGVTAMPAEPTESKDTKKGQLLWDKYAADKKAYETSALGKARRADLVVGAQVTFPEDLLYLQPISEKSGKPYKVLISKLPADTAKAVWSDELKQAVGPAIDPIVRKKPAVMPKLKGLSDRCFVASKDDLTAKLTALTRSDAAVWEGCAPKKVPKKGEPKEPKAPPNLVDPALMFKEGKNAGKYDDFDDDGMPKKKLVKNEGKDLKDAELKPLKKQWDTAKAVWDKHQAAMQTYQDEMKRLKGDLESGEDDFGVPEEQKKKSCEAAAKALVVKLVEEQLVRRSQELATEVNKGIHDTPELQEIVVQEKLEELEIITDPVLKAFRRFDDQVTNSCSAEEFKGVVRALGEDELQVGTHVFYSEASDEELDWTRGKLSQVGIELDGQMTYDALKTFIEASDVSVLPGKPPTNLVGCLTDMKIEQRLKGLSSMEVMWSPRTWRSKITEEFGSPGGASPKGGSPKGGSPKGKKKEPAKSKAASAGEGDLEAERQISGESVFSKEARKSGSKGGARDSKKVDEGKKDKKEVKMRRRIS